MDSGSKETKFYSDEQLREIADEIDRAVTIPVNMIIEAEHRVYDLSEIEKILREAKRITVQNCGCRTEYGNCNSPRDVCIGLEEEDYDLDNEKWNRRDIDLEEALQVLKRSHAAGLVHMAYVMNGDENPGLICSCCTCCCHTLGSLLRNGIHTQVLSSKLVAQNDESKCIDCGECVGRCVFLAREMNQDKMHYDSSKCMGCGLCVSTCPTETISMVPRDD